MSSTVAHDLKGTVRSGFATELLRSKPRPWLWFVPVLALLGAVIIVPAAIVVWISFQRMRFYQITGFVGLENFRKLVVSEEFWQLTANSLIYVAGTLAIVLPAGLAAALLIQSQRKTGNFLRITLLLPWTLSQAVVGSFWLWILNPSYGPVSYALAKVGISAGLLLGNPDLALLLLVLITAWWSFPYAMVMISAAVQGIPQELYEAVAIDGGRRTASFRYVTLPFLMPVLGSTGMVLAILYLTLITLIIVLTGGGPIGATSTWSFEVFRWTVQSVDIGPAAALSVVVMMANLMLGWGYLRLTGRVSA